MPSIISSLSYQYKMQTNTRRGLKKQLSTHTHGSLKDMTPPKSIERRYHVQADSLYGRPVYYMDFKNTEDKPCILYFHGGTFLTGLKKKHWRFIKTLLFGTGCPVVIPDYPLIPEHTHKKILAFCEETYLSLIPKCPQGIVVIGDGAGANLAMATVQQVLQEGLPTPRQLLLLSPCLDLTGANPIKNVLAHRDPVLEPDSQREAALLYAGSLHLNDPLISPVFGSMKGLPKVSVWTGDNDILYADSLLLKEALQKAHTPYHIYTYPHMIHNWMFDRIPEGRTALRQIVMTLREYL